MLKSIRNAEKERESDRDRERGDIWLIKSSKWRARVILIERRPSPGFSRPLLYTIWKITRSWIIFALERILNLESLKNIGERIASVIRWIITAGSKSFGIKIFGSVENILPLSHRSGRKVEGGGESRENCVLCCAAGAIGAGRANGTRKRGSSTHELESGAGAKSVGINEWNQISPRLLIRYRSLRR